MKNISAVFRELSEPYLLFNLVERIDSPMNEHSHNFYQIILMTDGALTVSCGGSDHELLPGDVHILPPGVPHELKPGAYSQLGIDFSPCGRSPYDLFADTFPSPAFLTLPEASERVAFLTSKVQLRSRLSIAQLNAGLDLLLCDLIGLTGEKNGVSFAERLSDKLNSFIPCRVRLADVADAMFISASHLERLCKRYFRTGVLEQLARRRVDRACVLLISTDLPVKSIGEAVAYPELSNFSTFFHSRTGLSPAQYRRNGGRGYGEYGEYGDTRLS